MGEPPFKEGDLVKIKGNDHIGLHKVEECEWYIRRDGSGYWRCDCSEQRKVNWNDILAEQRGVVMPGFWSGPYECLQRVS